LKRKSLSQEEIDYLFSIRYEDITLSKLKELFAYGVNKKPKFDPTDLFTLPANKLYNKTSTLTNVGRYIYNLLVLSPKLIQYTGYVNKALDKDAIDDIESLLSDLLLNDKIVVKDFVDYIDKSQWLGFTTSTFIMPPMNYDLIRPLPKVNKRKKELAKEYKDEIAANDALATSKIEKELLAIAKEELKDVPSMDLYNSSARAKFGNSYKNTAVMRGSIADNANPGTYTTSLSNLTEGIPKDEYHIYADLPVYASYERAVGTRDGGYESKKLLAAFQTIVLDAEGTDCGTKKTVKFLITSKNKSKFLYRFIIERNKFVLLDRENINEYVGKVVEMRSPLYCVNEKICNKCAGQLYSQMGIENVGLLANRIGTKILNLALKSFHDTTFKFTRINVSDFIES
jgi:hypothetical protein